MCSDFLSYTILNFIPQHRWNGIQRFKSDQISSCAVDLYDAGGLGLKCVRACAEANWKAKSKLPMTHILRCTTSQPYMHKKYTLMLTQYAHNVHTMLTQ